MLERTHIPLLAKNITVLHWTKANQKTNMYFTNFLSYLIVGQDLSIHQVFHIFVRLNVLGNVNIAS